MSSSSSSSNRAAMVLAVLGLALSGCSGAETLPAWCSSLGAHCERSASGYRIHDLHLDGDVGLRITTSENVEISNVTLTATTAALWLNLCASCDARIERANLKAQLVGVEVEGGRSVRFSSTNITMSGGGHVEERASPSASATFVVGGSDGLVATNPETLDLQGVSIKAERASAGTAIRLEGLDDSQNATLFKGMGLRLEGFRQGIAGPRVRAFEVHDVRVNCQAAGAMPDSVGVRTASPTPVARKVEVTDCGAAGMQFMGELRAGGVYGHTQRLLMEGLTVNGSRIALDTGYATVFELEDFRLSNGSYGIFSGADNVGPSHARIGRGSIQDFAFLGLRNLWKDSKIEAVSFRHNGHSWPDPNPPRGTTPNIQGGALNGAGVDLAQSPPAETIVTACAFEDNRPYGFSGTAALAQGNWWGSVAGPSVKASGDVPSLAGDGISPGIDAFPFLTAPP